MSWFHKEPEIRKIAALHAAGALTYIGFVALLLTRFDGSPDLPEVLMAMTMLSVFVFSAAVMAMLFFFRPVAYLIEGKKKEAALFVGWTLAFFFTYVFGILLLAKLFII